MMTEEEAYARVGREDVAGWFDPLEALVFVAASRSQSDWLTGDLLEIGTYLGKSAILLGMLKRPSERLIVVDLFESEKPSDEMAVEHSRFYEGLTLQEFRANFARYHRWVPDVLVGDSAEVLANVPTTSVRFLHVDGSHSHAAVRADIAHARRVLLPDGIVAFDDMLTAHTPGVQAAVWAEVGNGLVPLAIGRKLYATWSTRPDYVQQRLLDQLTSFADIDIGARHLIGAHPLYELSLTKTSASTSDATPIGRSSSVRRLVARTKRLQTRVKHR